jgi:tetratricopeptide (TPR) repeat protein/KaiC/GvpD/RAD55 family RecA-like ATPase
LKTGVLAEPVLVGREHELVELMRSLDSAFKGKGTTVFVSGEAGSGKTRLVNEFLGTVKEKEIAILTSWCLSDVSVPYFPFMEAFNGYFSAKKGEEEKCTSQQQPRVQASLKDAEQTGDEEAEIKAWLVGPKQAGKTEKLQKLTPQAWKDLAVEAVTKALLSISAKKPMIMFIDDLQWADSASLSLLHYISRYIGAAKVLFLATYRSEELGPDAEGRPHPLLETLRLMRREDLFTEIKLSNLNQTIVTALAEKMVGGSLHSELADKLAEESGGNPLFIVESLRMLSEHGSLIQDNGRWRLSIDEVGIPVKIKDIILRRVSMLKPNQRRILDLASVIGDKFDVELLGSVLSQDSLEVLETLNSIGQFSSLVCCKGSYFEFDHAKSREAIYDEISPPLKKGYHERIAEKMEAKSQGAKDLPVNDLAYHYTQAGNEEKAVEYALAAGEDSLARFSNAEAASQFTYVLNTVRETPKYADERVAALEGLGDSLSANGLFVEATKKFELLNSIAESGVVKLRALRKALFCTFWSGDSAHSLELGAKAEDYAQFDRLEYARLRLQRGNVARNMGKNEQANEDVEGALRVFEEEYSLPDAASALANMVFSYLTEDRFQEELAAALRSVALYEELKDLRGQLLARNHLDWPLREAGLYREALDNNEKSVRIGEKIGDYNRTALMLWGSGIIHDLIGDYGAAVAKCLKGAEYAERTSAYLTQNYCYSLLVREYAKLGEIEHAEEFAKKIEKLFDEAASLRNSKDSVENVSFSKALLFSAKGQWKEANQIFEELFEKKDKSLWGTSQWGSGKKAVFIKDYAWALAKQGRNEEAKIQLEEAKKIREKVAVELERLEHANVQAYLMALRETGVGEEFHVRIDLVNVAKNHSALIGIEGLIPPEIKVSALPSYCSVQNGSVAMKGRELGSFAVEPLKLSLQATKPGVYTLSPQVVYIDDLGETKTCKPRPVTVTVRPTLHAKIGEETITVPILPGRVTTGSADLDVLLCGGIPENYAVILTSPATDEKEQLIKRFLEAGTTTHATTVYITTEPGTAKALAKSFLSDFFLFICNPRADAIIESLSNVFKFKGVENLTEIDIALAKVFRIFDPSKPRSKRACVDVASDVLLQHHAVTTRKWISGLLADLRAKGFTTLVTVNPKMHPPEEVQAILGLFQGEINITEKETTKGLQQTLRIRKLYNQKYLENEIILQRTQ